jgi:hypothetical protein
MHAVQDVLARLQRDASARAVYVIDSQGDVVAAGGENEAACADLADLSIQQLGAAEGIARLVGEREFGILFHDRSGQDVHIAVLSDDRILVLVFDQNKTSLGVVPLQVRAYRDELVRAVSSEP